MSLILRDQFIRACWVPADFRVPENNPRGPHYPVQVWGVIDDPRLRLPDEDGPFTDIVSYWPAAKRWTVSHVSRAADEPFECECRVILWQPLPPMAW